jgi:hypothetical protein
LSISRTERRIGDRDAASRVLEMAETGYATIAAIFARRGDPDQKSEIAQKLAELRARLDTEQDCFNADW